MFVSEYRNSKQSQFQIKNLRLIKKIKKECNNFKRLSLASDGNIHDDAIDPNTALILITDV